MSVHFSFLFFSFHFFPPKLQPLSSSVRVPINLHSWTKKTHSRSGPKRKEGKKGEVNKVRRNENKDETVRPKQGLLNLESCFPPNGSLYL